MNETEPKRILIEGLNCWRRVRACHASFLIDAASYFEAFVDAVERARKSIIVVGWDVDSRIALLRENGYEEEKRLLSFLNSVVSKKKGLHAYVLVWDHALIYALEREVLPSITFGWRTNSRLHFIMDGNHPLGASHHQKIVVVDDAVAFIGGMDLTRCRWDTPEHRECDPRRWDPWCGNYQPFHDVQMIVDGDAAVALGDIARERWYRATGEKIPIGSHNRNIPWPSKVVADIKNVMVAIARTEPAYNGYPEVREVEALYRDAIATARRFVYIESQYFTSTVVADAITRKLQEENGPEIVIVLPLRSSGWIEEKVMDVLRAGLLQQLIAADRFGRLGIFYPSLPWDGGYLNVHSKVLVVDNNLVRVGSSNLSNRSMGLDTECDIAFEASGDVRIVKAIDNFRSSLVGEHLGAPQEVVSELTKDKNSLIGTIEALRGRNRSLEPLDGIAKDASTNWLHDLELLDPDSPVSSSDVVGQFVPDEIGPRKNLPIWRSIAVLSILLALATAWHWTPLKDILNLDVVLRYAHAVRDSRFALPITLAVYTIGGLVLFPVTFLIVATAVTFPPIEALVFSLAGSLASALLTYFLGLLLGRRAIVWAIGPRLGKLIKRFQRHGFLTVIILRLFPVAPYTVINLLAGASRIRLTQFIAGSLLGLAPGIASITLFGEHLESAIQHPRPISFLFLFLFVIIFFLINLAMRRWLFRKK